MSIFGKKVPMVYQIEAAECGAASICMVLGYYGRFVSLNQMRRDTHASRDGVSVKSLIDAASKYGLKVDGYKKDSKLEGIQFPAIVFWQYNHFLVVEKMTKKHVYLCDPAKGKRKITKEEFEKNYSGVVLNLEKTEEFTTGGEKFNMFKIAFDIINANKMTFVYLIILTLFFNVISIMIPAFSKEYIDYNLSYVKYDDMNYYFMVYFLLIGISLVLQIVKNKCTILFVKKDSFATSLKIFQKVLRLPMEYFERRSISTIVMKLMGVDSLIEFVSLRLISSSIGLVFSLVYISLIFYFGVTMGFVCIAIVLISVFIMVKIMKMARETILSSTNENIRFFTMFSQSVRLYDTIKASANDDITYNNIINPYYDYMSSSQKSKLLSSALQIVPITLPLIMQVFIVSIGSVLVIKGRMTIGSLLLCQNLSLLTVSSLLTFIVDYSVFESKEPDVREYEDINSEEEDRLVMRDVSPSIDDTKLEGNVKFSNVSFTYNVNKPNIIEDVSFEIKKGHSIAIVGSSGSGKSTLLRLLEGTYTPGSGEILIDGTTIDKINRKRMADSIAIVSQNQQIFSNTIRENISLFNFNVNMDEIVEATKLSCIHDEIIERSDAYNEKLDFNSVNFSVGQLQRMMIARALVKKPSILILDEATSALDTIVEEEIMKNIKAKGITLIIVAHRLSTIRDCDEILVLDKGKIVERGCHDELINNKDSLYLQLLRAEEEK